MMGVTRSYCLYMQLLETPSQNHHHQKNNPHNSLAQPRFEVMAMELTVTMLGGEAHSVIMGQNSTVKDLKRRISEVFNNLPVTRIKLSRDDGQKTQLSDDSKALSFYGLTSGSRLFLLVTPEPKPFDVFLKNEKGQTSVYQVTLEETVIQFKSRVCEKLKVPVDQQRLIHNGKQLDDGRILAEYDIKAGSVIYLTLRLRGG